MFLYVIRNDVDGKEYVGTTTRSLSLRMSDHRYRAKAGERHQPLYEAIREHGIEHFTMEPIGKASSYEELLALEQAEIVRRDTLHPNGYNLVEGGRGNHGWRMKTETRQKIAAKATGRPAWNKGRPATAEERARNSAARIAQCAKEKAAGKVRVAWNKGVAHTASAKAKMSASRTGKRWTAEHSEAMKGRCNKSPETRAKLAEDKRKWWASLTPEQHRQHVLACRGH